MKSLEDRAKIFRVSEPIFKLKVSEDGTYLEFTLEDQYDPNSDVDTDDLIMRLLASAYSERLDRKSGEFHKEVDYNRVFVTAWNSVTQIIVNASPLKNPKQTKLYKYFNGRDPIYNNPDSSAILALYEYMIDKGITNSRDNTNSHVKNVLAVLELLREKYERQN